MKINKLKWITPIQFWRYSFTRKPFDAIILIQHKNPPYENGYETLHIFRWTKKGEISINGSMADFAFKEFNPERDYKKLALLEYITK